MVKIMAKIEKNTELNAKHSLQSALYFVNQFLPSISWVLLVQVGGRAIWYIGLFGSNSRFDSNEADKYILLYAINFMLKTCSLCCAGYLCRNCPHCCWIIAKIKKYKKVCHLELYLADGKRLALLPQVT